MDIKSKIGPGGKFVFEECSISAEKNGKRKITRFTSLPELKQYLQSRIKQHREKLEELLTSYTDLERAFEPESFTEMMDKLANHKESTGVVNDGSITFTIDDAQQISITGVKLTGGIHDFNSWSDLEQAADALSKQGRRSLALKLVDFAVNAPTTPEIASYLDEAHYRSSGIATYSDQNRQASVAERLGVKLDEAPKKRTHGTKPKIRRVDSELPDDQELNIKASRVSGSGEAEQTNIFSPIAGVIATTAVAGIASLIGNSANETVRIEQA